MLADLTPEECEAVRKRLDGHSTEEIAKETSWHPRKVQRFFQSLHDSWSLVRSGGAKP
jgi:hypothetical protein